MMFRRIYWVTEELVDGDYRVTGVYTSNIDLADTGMRSVHGGKAWRVSLVQLDNAGDVLGKWNVPGVGDMRADLQKFVDSGEMSIEERDHLVESLSAIS